MIRVLHVVGGLDVGGTESWLAAGISFVDFEKYHFDFLVHSEAPQYYRSGLELKGARVLVCPGPRRFVGYAVGLWRILRRNRYDVIHAHTHASSGLALAFAALAKIPVRVFHSHTSEDESQVAGVRGWYFRGARWLIRRFSTRGIAVSEEAAAPMFPPDWRLRQDCWMVSQGGIDLKAFAKSEDREAIRRAIAVPTKAAMIIHVGRFAAVKNHAILVDIGRQLQKRDRAYVFVLVGDGKLRKQIETKVREAGLKASFRFLGVRSDIATLLIAADAFVMPSMFEGFPRAYLEAQAAGLPCVISNVIASAADVFKERITRLSLQDPVFTWASALQKACEEGRREVDLQEFRQISIEESMRRMLKCYA